MVGTNLPSKVFFVSQVVSEWVLSECSTERLRASILRADSWADGQGHVNRLRRDRCARVAGLDRKGSNVVAHSQRTANARYIDHDAFSWHKRTIGIAGAQPGIRRCDRPVERPGTIIGDGQQLRCIVERGGIAERQLMR